MNITFGFQSFVLQRTICHLNQGITGESDLLLLQHNYHAHKCNIGE